MNYTTHNQDRIDVNGTHLQGYIGVTFDCLCELFGEPTWGDEYKVDWEWMVQFEDGTVATVYNWKNGPNYCGHRGMMPHMIKEWHVGGHTREALNHVQDLLKAMGAA
tara:strand:- start:3328 stop:3648 length:321 start_codon:yes stop_codon:yes gene_type:complete